MKNVHKLTEGAILLAAVTVLLLITIYVPVIGSFLNVVLPAPFIIFAAKNNIKNISAFFLAAIVISFIAGSLPGLGLMLLYGPVGVFIGYMLQKNKSRNAILISSSLILMAGIVIYYVVITAFIKFDIIHELHTALNQSLKDNQELLKAMGNEKKIKDLKEQNANLIKMIEIYAPSYLILGSVLMSFVIQWVCFPIVKRFGINVQPWGKFRNLSLPKSLLWYYLIALGAMLVLRPQEGTYLLSVLLNARYILEFFLIFQGLSFLFYFFHQRSVAKGLGIFVAILSFTIPLVHTIIMLVGITDLGFDFRKQFAKKE
ncbi:YybS family protein [Neobacillus sp. NPDC097160]|uniref:YybS family protein n=1 Tax=Neobacillus sp. NPDC097160 TaxID=3364298 RepID=UPI00381F2BA5